jgi:glycosyltransferase involved in cell wall biosynthesis
MANYPRIALVMPSLNQSRYIEEAIGSVLDQNYPNLEFLILDGGSTDGSQKIVQRYSSHLAYWHSGPDGGQTNALIEGFARSSGELMGWLNSDDVLLPGALFQIACAYQFHPNCSLFGGNFLLIDEQSKILRCQRTPAQAAFFARYGNFAMGQPGSFFTRKAYEKVGGLHAEFNYFMDADLYFRMMHTQAEYFKINAWISAFRLHPLSKSVTQSSKWAIESSQARKKYLPWIKSERTGRLLLIGLQMVNGNYARVIMESALARGQGWIEWCSRKRVGNPDEST